jgi:hypothetical protein
VITPTPAPKIVNKKFIALPYAYAVALIALVAWQLVMFERFAPYIAGYLGQGSQASAAVISMVLIGMELFAIPFLLRMQLSPLARFFSAGFAFVVPLAWAVVTMMGGSFNIAYLFFNIGFFAWGGASFWALGGPQAMHLGRR